MSSGEGKTDENGQGRTKTDGDGKQYSVSPVWTGSAADYDKPSLHYVGTGEGAQVYGWGLYGSSEKGVGRTYAEADAVDKNTEEIFFDGKKSDTFFREWRDRERAEGRNAAEDPEYLDLSVLIQRLKDFHGLTPPRNAGQRQRTRRRPVRVVERWTLNFFSLFAAESRENDLKKRKSGAMLMILTGVHVAFSARRMRFHWQNRRRQQQEEKSR